MAGSSPRLRGTRAATRTLAERRRFIPAPAGNTSSRDAGRSLRRFIPAPAGNTPMHVGVPACDAVHPRACGEHRHRRARRTASPVHPRACGEHASTASAQSSAKRFIPAPAGNTRQPSDARRHAAVHPRACGEHALCDGIVRRAHAVHPRACGEHGVSSAPSGSSAGSSPRLRGTPEASAARLQSSGSSPRLRGTRAAERRPSRLHAVHPRACGEHDNAIGEPILPSGSSPRLRGTLLDVMFRRSDRHRHHPTLWNALAAKDHPTTYHLVPKETGRHIDATHVNAQCSKRTRVSPSNSTASRRFGPAVSNAKPESGGRCPRHHG